MGKGHRLFQGSLNDQDTLLKELVMYILAGVFTGHRIIMLKQRARQIWKHYSDD